MNIIQVLSPEQIKKYYADFTVVRFNKELQNFETLKGLPSTGMYSVSEGTQELELIQ